MKNIPHYVKNGKNVDCNKGENEANSVYSADDKCE